MAVVSKPIRVRYVSKDRDHPLRSLQGTVLARGYGPGPRNELVLLDDGRRVVAPWGNWRVAEAELEKGGHRYG